MQKNLMLDVPFLRLWTSNTASGLATWALPFVFGLTIVAGDLDAAHVGLALAVRTIGFVLAMPVGGVMADRSGPRRMIFGAGLLAAFGIFPIVAGLAGYGGVTAILIGAGIAGFGQGACRASYQAIIPRVVREDQHQPANAAMTISIRVSTMVGPTLATASVLAIGSSQTLLIVALFWIVAAVLPTWPPRMTKTKKSQLTATGFLAELLEGFAEANRHPWFMAGLAALTLVIAFGYSVTSVLLPQISNAQYGGAQMMATAVTAYTIGAFVGAIVISRWRPKAIGWLALIGLAIYGFVPLSLLFSHIFILPIIAFFFAGLGIEFFNVPWFTAAQREVPKDRLARVTSLDFLFSYGLAPLGLAGLTPLTELVGTNVVLVLSALICFGAPLMAMLARGSRGFTTTAS